MDQIWLDEMADDQLDQATLSLLYNSSDDDDTPRKHGGSAPGKAPNLERGRIKGGKRLFDDYFAQYPIYDSQHFVRRFRIARSVFMRLVEAIEVHDPYFTQRKDCTGKLGFTTLQKATAAMRLLAYGSAADSIDEYVRMGESTALDCLEHFFEGVVACFSEEYMRSPTEEDLETILARSVKNGFPGMIGSIDCSKWYWKNCPTAYHGQFEGKEGIPAVTIECIADDCLWIWHCFFGMPGCANDINVLDASPLSNKMASGTYPPPIEYNICNTKRNIPYWLADGIYPKWPCFVQTISQPLTRKEKLMATSQEARRKDAERAFGVFQGKWHILQRPSRFWYMSTMKKVVNCSVILHNMMIEYGNDNDDAADRSAYLDATVGQSVSPMWAKNVDNEAALPPPGSLGGICALARFTGNEAEYFKTRELVMEYLWARLGEQ